MITPEVSNILEDVVQRRLARANNRTPVTQAQLQGAVRAILLRTERRAAAANGNSPAPFEFARAVRGLAKMQAGFVLNSETVEEDVYYAQRALATSTPPGSYLVPTIQADAIVSQLSQLAVARIAGATIWPMAGIQTLTAPVALTSPTFVFTAQNSKQSPDSATSLGQMTFDLKSHYALILLPAQLFRVSVPTFDILLEDFFALGAAESEDAAMFASSTLSADAPTALASQSGISVLNVGNSANGGNLSYSDILAVLQKALDVKLRPPYCWFLNGRTALRCLSLSDTTSRPIWIPGPEGIGPQIGHLLGWPVYATASIPTNESIGSGSSQSHLILTNPSLIHIGEDRNVSMDVSSQFALESEQLALRIGHRVSMNYQPAAGIVILTGIN